MALQLEQSSIYGTDYNYGKLVQTNFNWLDKTSYHIISWYINKTARQLNKTSIAQSSISINGDDFDFDINGNLLQQVYEKFKKSILNIDGKETNLLVNAIDV